MNNLLTAVGAVVMVLWLLGAVGLADFKISFGPVPDDPAIVDCRRQHGAGNGR